MSGKKIAIVTGASSGMGREMVYLLADHFAALEEIWVVARRKERLEELVGKVPVRLRILPLDLTSEEDLGALSVLLKREQPNVKILVNGAGYGKTGAVGTIRRDLSVGMAPGVVQLADGVVGTENLAVCVDEDRRSGHDASVPFVSDNVHPDSRLVNKKTPVPEGERTREQKKGFQVCFFRRLEE